MIFFENLKNLLREHKYIEKGNEFCMKKMKKILGSN